MAPSISNATCQTALSLSPNKTTMAEIRKCQLAAKDAYCYPPNGTRICVPAEDITFFYPPTHYHPTALIYLTYDLTSRLTLFRPSTGNATQSFTPWMYDNKALAIPGSEREKSMKMYLLERRTDDKVDPYNIKTYEGPEIVLVKTAEWSSSARASATATGTGTAGTRVPSGKIGQRMGLSRSETAGIAFGTIALVIFIVCGMFFLYTRIQTAKRKKRPVETTAPSVELGGCESRAEISGLDATTATATTMGLSRRDSDGDPQLPPYVDEDPPKYTP